MLKRRCLISGGSAGSNRSTSPAGPHAGQAAQHDVDRAGHGPEVDALGGGAALDVGDIALQRPLQEPPGLARVRYRASTQALTTPLSVEPCEVRVEVVARRSGRAARRSPRSRGCAAARAARRRESRNSSISTSACLETLYRLVLSPSASSTPVQPLDVAVAAPGSPPSRTPAAARSPRTGSSTPSAWKTTRIFRVMSRQRSELARRGSPARRSPRAR